MNTMIAEFLRYNGGFDLAGACSTVVFEDGGSFEFGCEK